MPLGIICAAGLGFLLERVILRKVKFSSFVNLLIATVGVSYVLRNASMVIWGTNPQLFPSMFPSELIEIGEFRITPQSIGIIIISLAIITGLHFFFTKVKIGKCMQLANSDPEGAAMMGVNVTYMRFLTFGISAALACIAGVMIAPLTYARVDMSATIGMKAFAAAILGGIGNLWGALLGGIILGIVAIVLAVKAVKEAGKDGKATGGKVCGIIGIVLSVLSFILYLVILVHHPVHRPVCQAHRPAEQEDRKQTVRRALS